MMPLLINWALVGEMVFTFLSNCFAIFEIVQGSSSQFTMANINFFSPSEHLSYLSFKETCIQCIEKVGDIIFYIIHINYFIVRIAVYDLAWLLNKKGISQLVSPMQRSVKIFRVVMIFCSGHAILILWKIRR